jgi:hypothetical protein
VRAPRWLSTPAARDALVLPAIRTSVLFIVSGVSVTADWVRYEHASCRRDGDGADKQKDGREADKDKTVLHKMYERVVGGVAKILGSRPKEGVATKTEVSGRLDNPQVSTIETIVKLIENAFFKSILPGFDREVARTGPHAAAGSTSLASSKEQTR